MSGRPNWYSDHPPACTCATCRGDSGSSRRRFWSRRRDAPAAEGARRTGRRQTAGNTDGGGGNSPGSQQPEFPGSGGRRIGRAVVWVAVFAAFAAGMVWVLVNDDMRSGIGEWLSVQLGATPTPAPVVALAPEPPTPTATPTPPVPTASPIPRPTSTPAPEPMASLTPSPTPTSTPEPTPVIREYSMDELDVKLVKSDNATFTVDFTVSVMNVGARSGQQSVELRMSVDGGAAEMVAVIPGLTPGEAESFVFSRDFPPGRYAVAMFVGDARSEVSIELANGTVAVLDVSVPSLVATSGQADTQTANPAQVPAAEQPPTATPTPIPIVSLALDASTSLVGYWPDGTANVEVNVLLSNEGDLRFDEAQMVTVSCAGDDGAIGCRDEAILSLPDGYGPTSTSFLLRLPMSEETGIQLDYGNDEPLKLAIDVPERVLGVDRELWECYRDRPQERVEIGGEFFDGCGGWSGPTVEKWLNDVPVKVWATGDPVYIETLESVLNDLSPVLDVEFEWVESEPEADFKAFVGVPQAEVLDLGFEPSSVDYGGFAGVSVVSGEAVAGYMVVWDIWDSPGSVTGPRGTSRPGTDRSQHAANEHHGRFRAQRLESHRRAAHSAPLPSPRPPRHDHGRRQGPHSLQ